MGEEKSVMTKIGDAMGAAMDKAQEMGAALVITDGSRGLRRQERRGKVRAAWRRKRGSPQRK